MALSDDILKLKDVFNGANPLQAGMNQAGGTLQLPNVQDIQAPQVAAPQPLAGAMPDTYNAAMIGVPDFNEPYVYPQAAQAYGNVPVNMPSNPLDSGNQIAPAFRRAQSSVIPRGGVRTTGTGGFPSPMAASRTGGIATAENPDIGMAFSSFINPSEEQKAANVAGGRTGGIQSLPTNVVQPPTGDIGMAAESPIEPQSATPPSGVIPPEGLNAPAAATPQIGGTITRGGETTFFQQGGGQIATPSASQLSSFAEQQKGAEYNIVPELGADKPGFGPTTRANIAAGRPPNVSASEVASAQKQMAEQETARTIDRAVAEYEQSLPNGGLGASAADRAERAEKVAQYRAGLTAQQLSKQSTGQAGLTPYQAITASQRQQEIDMKKKEGMEAKEAKETVAFEEDTAQYQSITENASRLATLAQEAIGLTTEPGTTGIGGAFLKYIPASNANQLKDVLAVVQSDVALQRLANLKATGATLGQISKPELDMLQNSFDALGQNLKGERLREALVRYTTNLSRVEAKIENAYKSKYKDRLASQAATQESSPIQSGSMQSGGTTPSGRKVKIY